jgi:hypothetical protein
MQERNQYPQEDLEDGWQKRQEWQEDRTHDRTLPMLWKNLQICLKQEKNLDSTKALLLSSFFVCESAVNALERTKSFNASRGFRSLLWFFFL